MDIHGQSEGRALLDPERQRGLLDAFGGLEETLEAFRQARAAHEDLRKRRQALIDATEARQRERALLEFEHDELAAADPRVGEYDELVRESHRLANAEAIRAAAAGRLRPALRGRSLRPGGARAGGAHPRAGGGLGARAGRGRRRPCERLADETRDVAYGLRDLGQRWDDDPARLEEIEARLALYRRLATRFRVSPDELAARLAETEAKLADARRGMSRTSRTWTLPSPRSFRTLKDAAAALTTARRKTRQGLRPGDPVAAQAAWPGEGAPQRRDRDPRPGR